MNVRSRKRPATFRPRLRELLALSAGVISVVALSTGVTSAFWTDSSTVTTGTITAGIMDLQLQTSRPVGAQGPGTAYDATDITVTGITPAESRSFPVIVTNVGNADFTFSATVARSATATWGFADGSITVQFFAGTPDTSDVTYPVQQACSGPAFAAAQPVEGTNTTAIPNVGLAAGGSRTLCALVTMTSTAPNSDQGKSGVLRVDVVATQVTS